jgi:release factor glutamine methyltransferase
MDAATATAPLAETIDQLLVDASAELAAAGVHTPRLDAEVLLAAACEIDRSALYARGREAVPPRCRDAFRSTLARRVAREPLQYIVGRQEFWSLDFRVTGDVLIPRPETELLVELALVALRESGRRDGAGLKLCDLGTGSGCVAIALARELPSAEIWALDVSSPALAVAENNGRRHGVANRVHFMQSDLFAAVEGRRFDAIISNPPYVSSVELVHPQPELTWEPRQALEGGVAGLDVIRRLTASAPQFLVEGGWLIVEIGADQSAAVQALAAAATLRDVTVYADYAELPRVLVARR